MVGQFFFFFFMMSNIVSIQLQHSAGDMPDLWLRGDFRHKFAKLFQNVRRTFTKLFLFFLVSESSEKPIVLINGLYTGRYRIVRHSRF